MDASPADAMPRKARIKAIYKIWVEYVALATVASIPLSTSATSILVALWAGMALAMLSWTNYRDELIRPRSMFFVLLALLGIAGLLWSEATWPDRLNGVGSFARFLLLPLFAAYFGASGLARKALYTFLISCSVILLISLGAFWFPAITFWRPGYPVVPFKDATTQSLECALCALGLLIWLGELRPFEINLKTTAAALLAALFLGDIVYVATSRTELVAILVTLPLLAIRRWKWRGFIGGIGCVIAVSVAAWCSSSNIQERIRHAFWEYQRYETLDQGTSVGARLEFWQRSILIMSQAPFLGHGTGSIEHMFEVTASSGPKWIGSSHEVGTHVARSMVTPNPHNQTFAVGIQLGLIGVAFLYAMWLAQVLNFFGSEPVNTLGLMFVVQFVIGSIFYSYIFDFTEAWMFIIGSAVLYGMQGVSPSASDSFSSANSRLS